MRNAKPFRKENYLLAASAVCCIAAFLVLFGETVWPGHRAAFLPGFEETQDFVKLLNVGEGDSILIYSDKQAALVDTGDADMANEVCYQLSACGIHRLKALMLTHPHMDHAGGVGQITDRFSVENLIVSGNAADTEAEESIQAAKLHVRENGGRIYTAVQGMYFSVGGFTVTVLFCDPQAEKENDRSVVAMAEMDDRRFLLTGDMEETGEAALLKERLDLRCDVLKVAHHGGKTASGKAFLKAASPQFAAISVGRNNIYGHPNAQTLSALQACKAEIFRTDQNGCITFFVENGGIRVETDR